MADAPKTLQSALVEALAEMPNPVKNAENPAFKRDGKPMRYADLEATLDACRPILAANGIALLQMPVNGEQGIGVRTLLIGHGEQMDCGTFVLPMEGSTPQKAAGAITYARRYALTALFGLAQEDDDGNGSSATKPAENHAPAAAAGAIGGDAPIVRAIFGKKSALGMTDVALKAAIKRDFNGKEHPGDLTMAEAKALADKMQVAIDAKKPAQPEPADDPTAPTAEELAAMGEIPF